jgi:TolB-like protein
VFLSYATEDRPVAQALRDALPAHGLEVWYDESGLAGGDVWDQKIRKQIRDCDFFMPLISANTEARHEGYFRREWRFAVERTLDMADDHTFLLPIVIDDTPQAGARVPEKFLSVQWTRVPGGQANAAFEALCRRLLAPEPAPSERRPRAHPHPPLGGLAPTPVDVPLTAPAGSPALTLAQGLPEFPLEQPGQKVRFWAEVLLWGLQSGWILFKRLPRWLRLIVYIYLSIALVSQCNSERHHQSLSAADAAKLKQITQAYQGSTNPKDIAKMVAQIRQEIARDVASDPDLATEDSARLLAVPFSASSADPQVGQVANATFLQLYGRVSVSHHGHVSLVGQALASPEAAAQSGREHHSRYVLYGAVEEGSEPPRLTVRILRSKDGSVLWSGSYPTAGADPAAIASEVDSRVRELEDED